ncbi:MAG: DJ-1/PfpI family protein, partial [Clostridia bacterium]|nr:DJ-1/PfpI family protein [Clostridia bacterium]
MVYMFLAEGFEETEAIGCLDVLRRAEIEALTVGVGGKEIKGSHGISVVADIELEKIDFDSLDGVILPGGMPGTMNLQAEEK